MDLRLLPFAAGHLPEHAGELVGAGGAAAGAIDTAQALDCKAHRGAFKQSSKGLQVAVATGKVFKVVDTPVHQVEIYQLGAYQRAGSGRNMADTVLDGIN